MSDEAPAGLCDAKLATGERAEPRDGISGTPVPGRFRLEQSQHSLCAVRSPDRHDSPVSFAERLRRTHAPILPVVR
jgi:hypothetical protein